MKSLRRLDTDSLHGHACVFYESAAERFSLLADYFRDGLERHEQCIFVTHDDRGKLRAKFKSHGLDITDAVRQGDLKIFNMNEAYLQDDNFIADYMLDNVKSFLTDAKRSGYSGLRTAGEMSWIYSNPDFITEALHYESSVNHLSAPGVAFTGICLYPAKSSFSQASIGAMQTHPGYISYGKARLNPFYKPLQA